MEKKNKNKTQNAGRRTADAVGEGEGGPSQSRSGVRPTKNYDVLAGGEEEEEGGLRCKAAQGGRACIEVARYCREFGRGIVVGAAGPVGPAPDSPSGVMNSSAEQLMG